MEYAKAHNMIVTVVYADRHLTGKTDRRPDFQRMIRAAERREFQVVLTYKSSRIARNMLHALSYENKLDKYDVRIVYVKEEFGDNAAGRFALRTMMNVNQFYSENMSDDIKRGMYDNALRCMITNGHLPLGYKKSEDNRYALDKPNAAIVLEIFVRLANYEPFVDIGNDLNRRGIKTSHGKEWGKDSVQKIARNERYTGVYIYGDIRIEGGVPQIVSKELFLTVQERLKTKKNPQGRRRENGDYLLTGKLFCGKCKSPMVGISGTSKTGKLHSYYYCQKKRLEKTCDKQHVRRDWIENEVTAVIREYIMRDDVIEWMADNVMEYSKKCREQSDAEILASRLADVNKAIKNTMSAIEQGIFTPTIKDRLVELEEEREALNSSIILERAALQEFTRDDILSALEAFRDGEIEDKEYQAELFRMFLTAVYVCDDELEILFEFTKGNNSVMRQISTPSGGGVALPNVSLAAGERSYSLYLRPPRQIKVRCVGLSFRSMASCHYGRRR
jgi:DNA invertase Pin-like site-specific DNA recombinase